MRLEDLRNFVAVVEAGSLTSAAANLLISQPALSQRMNALEKELNAQLLERSVRGVRPTPAGVHLYRRALSLVREFDELSYDLSSQAHGISGPVAVGLPTSTAVPLIPPLVSWVRRTHPGIHLQIFESTSGYIRELLQWERLDVAVQFRNAPDERAGELPLFHEELYLVGRPGALFPASVPGQDNTISVHQLAGIPLVVSERHSNLRGRMDSAFLQAGVHANIVAEVDSLHARAAIAASGEACSVLPRSVVHAYAHLDLDLRRITDPVIERWAVALAGAARYPLNEAVGAVLQGLQELTRELAADGIWQLDEPRTGPRVTGRTGQKP